MKSTIGWKFPPTFTNTSTGVEVIADHLDIKQSLFILFSTHPGERKIFKDYGCNLRQFLFQRSSSLLINSITKEVEQAISKYEQRITVFSLDVNKKNHNDGEYIEINLIYKINLTEEISEFNFRHDNE